MVDMKNNNGIKLSLYVSKYGSTVVLVQADFIWYDKNATCDLSTFLAYKDSVETMFENERKRLNESETPITKQRLLSHMVRFAIANRFEYDFCKGE